jgi:ligand-binding SRPBCC domain-containing protein
LFVIKDSIHINAPIERCFLLSTNLALIAQVLEMRLVATRSSRTSGTIQGEDRLVWRGWKFGLPHMHESVITRFERPIFFQDAMGRGRFKQFQLDHHLSEVDGHTLLIDKLRFSLPLGLPGKLVAKYVIIPYLSGLLRKKMLLLKRLAEGEGWRQYLPEEDGVRRGTSNEESSVLAL